LLNCVYRERSVPDGFSNAACNENFPIPGPSPLHQPVFLPYFVEFCQQILRQRSASYAQHQRARLVLLLHEHPALDSATAATRVALHPNSVRLWRQRWCQGDFSLEDLPGRGRKTTFPPAEQALVKAIACEAVYQTDLPLSRLSVTDLGCRASQALGKPNSPSTTWRILDGDTIKPWRYEYWIYLVTHTSPTKPVAFWICTPAGGKVNAWGSGIM
jgi:hypothetical protein